MSDTIYDDVTWTETEGMKRERVEMTVDIYESADYVRDHDFRTETNTHQPLQRTGSDSVKIRSSRAAAVCFVLMCVLLLTAVIVLCVHTEEKEQLLNKINNLTEERDQLLTTLKDYKTEKYLLMIQNNNLTIENKDLLFKHDVVMKQREQENNDLWKNLHEVGGCFYHESSLYIISLEKKSWAESRQDCKARGADLITINNSEEQGLVTKMSDGSFAWIGLTDSDLEGRWKWVDGSRLESDFWRSGEPNGHKGENCVVSYASQCRLNMSYYGNINIPGTHAMCEDEEEMNIYANAHAHDATTEKENSDTKRHQTPRRTDKSCLYYFSSERKSWTESRKYCMERRADLITINNKEKQQLFRNLFGYNRVWIGLTDSDLEGRWKWVDGSTLTSGFWGYGEPNGYRGENCAVTFAGQWADRPCIYESVSRTELQDMDRDIGDDGGYL
ncbi:oxidized low-density lipoprotein receptor 1-like [Carassius auratus]|uniref:Oxidized low-density lipoprotein receptor 1-like n=1 Tax=Carassius auratus TaxID=7957 RepID=A0A6P6NBS9_CARAU|nr:oxidized low-density lipoprotein receptor 1-like [Carassius auratus]